MSRSRRIPSDIPVGTQFSPDLIDLGNFVKALLATSGDKSSMQAAIWQPGVRIAPLKKRLTERMKSLPLEAAIQYGLLDDDYQVTPLTLKLAALEPPELYDEFARHILLQNNGLRVIDGLEQMIIDRVELTGDRIARFLTSQSLRVSIHNTAINTMRMWLAKAGLFPENGRDPKAWYPAASTKQRLLGMDQDAIAILSGLNDVERAFVEMLCRISPVTGTWYRVNDLRDSVETQLGIEMPRGNSREYVEALVEAGIVEYKSGGTSAGKSAVVRITDKFHKEVLEPFVTTAIKGMNAPITSYFRQTSAQIYGDLGSKNTYKKGRALEAYVILIMRLLGLRFLEWRKRARETGGAEVDALFSGVVGAVPTRWQVQCKNTPAGKLQLEDVAREVGLVSVTQATHILMVATTSITRAARDFALDVMYRTPLTIFLLDKDDFGKVRSNPATLGNVLRSQALAIVRQQPPASVFGRRQSTTISRFRYASVAESVSAGRKLPAVAERPDEPYRVDSRDPKSV